MTPLFDQKRTLRSSRKYVDCDDKLITDSKSHIRELGFRRILKARGQPKKGHSIRQFKVPQINFQALDCTDLIDWNGNNIQRTKPPLVKHISDETLLSCIQSCAPLPDCTFDLPCHSQTVERCVKMVTEASSSVFGRSSRDGYIRTTLLARQQLPLLETKRNLSNR